MRLLQDEKLRRLIRHAYHHVGYYRERMDALGLGPEDIRTLDDLAKLPLLRKADVRENLHFDLLSDNHDNDRSCASRRRAPRASRSSATRISTSSKSAAPPPCGRMEWTG